MKKPLKIHGGWGLLVGIVLGAAGASLMKQARFGMTSFYSVSLCLFEVSGRLTMGIWNTLFQLFLILILIFLQRRFRLRYLFSFVAAWAQSMMIDWFNQLFALLPTTFAMRLFSFSVGFCIMSAGIAVLAVCRLPVAPMNLFVREIAEKRNTRFDQVKSIFDLSCLGLSALIGRCIAGRWIGIGWGTLATALLTGSLTGLCLRWLNVHIHFYLPDRR